MSAQAESLGIRTQQKSPSPNGAALRCFAINVSRRKCLADVAIEIIWLEWLAIFLEVALSGLKGLGGTFFPG
jgi:hypothetical protein